MSPPSPQRSARTPGGSATGKEVPIAVGTKVGHLRQYSDQPQAGKIYFILFANRERAIKAGAKVTIRIGDFRAEHLTVE